MSSRNCVAAVVLVLGICMPLLAAPTNPINTRIDASVSGHAHLDGQFVPQDASYSQSGHAERFSSAGMRLGGDVRVGEVPGIPHLAGAGSSAGTGFQQVAPNEFVLELSALANGSAENCDPATFRTGHADSNADVTVNSDFEVLGQPGQPRGTPSTVLLHLEHSGMLHLLNRGQAVSDANVQVSGNGVFSYSDHLITPPLPMGPFDGSEFTGIRDRTLNGSIQTSVGAIFHLTAALHSYMVTDLLSELSFPRVQADSLFDSGLRLHLTVLPEPTTGLLLLGAALLMLRRR